VCCINTLLSDVATDNGMCVQEVAATAQDWQQLGEALSTTPATPLGSAEAPANGQSEGSPALQQAPAPQAERRAAKQVPATEGSPASEAPTASEGPTASASLPTAAAADTTAEARSTSTAGAQLFTAEVAAGTDKAAAQATTGSLLGKDPTLPTSAQVRFLEIPVIAVALISISCYYLVDLCWLHLLSAGHSLRVCWMMLPFSCFHDPGIVPCCTLCFWPKVR